MQHSNRKRAMPGPPITGQLVRSTKIHTKFQLALMNIQHMSLSTPQNCYQQPSTPAIMQRTNQRKSQWVIKIHLFYEIYIQM